MEMEDTMVSANGGVYEDVACVPAMAWMVVGQHGSVGG